MVNINLNIKKKDLWLLSAISIFLIGVGFVVAYGSGQAPNVIGHSAEELEVEIGGITYNLQQAITDGNLGAQGPAGPQGIQGIQGPAGLAAPSAICTWSSKTYSTGATCCQVGCFSSSTSGSNIYLCKTDGGWQNLGGSCSATCTAGNMCGA